MIIEFIGLPACGKTTISKSIHELKYISGKEIIYPLHEIYRKSWFCRNMMKFVDVTASICSHPVISIQLFKLIHEARPGVKQLCKRYFNCQFLYSQINKYRNHKGFVIFDEGILHHAWSIVVRAKSRLDIKFFLDLYGEYEMKLIYVNCDLGIIDERIKKRKIAKNSRHTHSLSDLTYRDTKLKEEIMKNGCLFEKKINTLSLDNDNKTDLERNINSIISWISEK